MNSNDSYFLFLFVWVVIFSHLTKESEGKFSKFSKISVLLLGLTIKFNFKQLKMFKDAICPIQIVL